MLLGRPMGSVVLAMRFGMCMTVAIRIVVIMALSTAGLRRPRHFADRDGRSAGLVFGHAAHFNASVPLWPHLRRLSAMRFCVALQSGASAARPLGAPLLGYPVTMKALHIHAGERARRHIADLGLSPQDVKLVPAAAGGPKGLILNHIDQHLFGHWLPQGRHTVHLVGASIGAWRMATAAMADPAKGFQNLARGYISQHIEPETGRKMPSAQRITAGFKDTLRDFFGDSVADMIAHPRYRLHVLTSRGRQVLRRGSASRTAIGFTGLALGNALTRKAVGLFLERTVFSAPGEPLPVPLKDLPTGRVELDTSNFMPAMLASCSIPFMLEAVNDIPGAPHGSHWDGGIVDYHFHWHYAAMPQGLVLYPHFQRQVVPGWLDKALKWRHGASPWLDNLVLLAPNPEWVARLPGGKLPDRKDFQRLNPAQRVKAWTQAVSQAEALAADWQDWLHRGCPADELKPL